VYTPQGSGPFPALVVFHGGCWIVGNIEISDAPHRALANATGCVVVAVNYQKAPEHPFPIRWTTAPPRSASGRVAPAARRRPCSC
jgi:acetyl esterase